MVVFLACKKDEEPAAPVYGTPYQLVIPQGLPPMDIPENNPMTEEGVFLGRKLFYDPILSGNNTQSCGSCHMAEFSFVDATQFSLGSEGLPSLRNVMPIINLGWQRNFFWDGGALDLESQVLAPIENPIEMHETLPNAMAELKAHPEYPALFEDAFGPSGITVPNLMRAIAQFERTLISGNSKYDRYARGEAELTFEESEGLRLYGDLEKGDCTHCHTIGSTFSDFELRNTGLDSISEDLGRMGITQLASDRGKFKTPSLRNVALTAPYMHDGRFTTLLECIEHYNTGFHYSVNLDANLFFAEKGRMTQQEMQHIVSFLHTLTDEDFVNNPAFQPQ